MNIDPAHLPQLAGAARLSKPGFDILLAISDARQAALPTVRMLRAQATRDRDTARVNALTHLLSSAAMGGEQNAARPVRFFDLSDDANDPTETVNSPFTRGFQSMLSLGDVAPWMSAPPIPRDEDNME